jgi:hypothetical protein
MLNIPPTVAEKASSAHIKPGPDRLRRPGPVCIKQGNPGSFCSFSAVFLQMQKVFAFAKYIYLQLIVKRTAVPARQPKRLLSKCSI